MVSLSSANLPPIKGSRASSLLCCSGLSLVKSRIALTICVGPRRAGVGGGRYPPSPGGKSAVGPPAAPSVGEGVCPNFYRAGGGGPPAPRRFNQPGRAPIQTPPDDQRARQGQGDPPAN